MRHRDVTMNMLQVAALVASLAMYDSPPALWRACMIGFDCPPSPFVCIDWSLVLVCLLVAHRVTCSVGMVVPWAREVGG
jgi:hypothetical protein